MAGKSQPLSQQFPIVTADGRPTEYFIRWAQSRQIDISKGVTTEQVEQAIADWAAARAIIAGNGLSGGGTLDADRTLTLDASLDDLNDVDFSTPPNEGDTLVFNDETGMFEPGAGSGGEPVEPTDIGPSGYYAAGSQPRKMWQLNILSNQTGNPNTSIMLAEIQFRTTPGVPQLVGPGVATASSVLGDGFASKAFDNNAGTFWHTAGTSAAWITYNFDEPINVQEVMIKLRDGGASVGGSPEIFEVRCSDDGIAWETIWTVPDANWQFNAETKVFTNPNIGALTNYYPTKLAALNDISDEQPEDGEALVWSAALQMWVPGPGGGGGGLPSGAAPGNVIEYQTDAPAWVDPANGLGGNPGVTQPYGKHAYWRFQSTQQGDNRYACIAELIFRAIPGGARISSVGQAIQGGNYGGNVAALAFDANPETVWESQNQDNTGPGTLWVGFHYDEPVSVTQVAIQVHPSYETDERPIAGNIQYSDDGAAWTTAWSVGGLGYPGNIEVLTSPNYVPPSGKYYLLPSGGNTGQVPVKASPADGHFAWADQTGGGGGSGEPVEGTDIGPVGRILVGAPSYLYWRILVLSEMGPEPYTSISNLEFRSQVDVAEQAVGGTPFSSGQLDPAYSAVNAFDLNIASTYISNGALPNWIGYQFPTPRPVLQIAMRNREGGFYQQIPKNFRVQGSNNGVDYVTVWEVLDSQFPDAQAQLTFNGPFGAAEYVEFYPKKIAALNDVSDEQPENGEALVWDSALGMYVPKPVSGGGGGGGSGTRIMAAARFDCANTAAPSILGGVNVSSIVKQGTGRYRVNFTAPIDIAKAGFNGGGAWLTDANATTVLVGVDRKDGTGLFADHVDLITFDGNADQLFDCNNWFSFELYDVTQQSGGGGGGGSPSPLWTGGVPAAAKAADFTVVKSSADFPVILHDEPDGLHMEVGVGGNPASDRTAYLERPIANLTFDFQALIVGQNIQRQYQNIGLAVRNSVSGRFVTFGAGESDTRGYNVLRWNSVGNYNGSYINNPRPIPAWPLWMRAKGDGTTLFFYMSSNGKYWTLVFGLPFADFVGAADRVGIHYVASQVSVPQNVEEHLHIMGWRQS